LQILLPGAVAGALGSQGQEEQQRLFWAVSEFIGEVSKNRPVALLLDDLHWADVSSLKLLHHVARRTRDERVYTLATYRDVEVGRQHPLEATLLDLTRDGLVQRIAVPRLDREGTRALVASTMGEQDISNEFTDLVYWRTEGNPFFVQQVLRMLVERGDVYREDGRWERKEIAEIDVPESIRSVVGQRFERLSVETQGILREAAVLGQVFYFDDLLAMAEYDEDDLEAALDEAIRSGLVREMEGDRYGFDHALTQQALYGELSRRRRRRLHRAAGEVIERLPERQREGIVAELAWHFLHAGETEKALQYSLEAGDEAESVFAHDEAAKYYHDALGFARQAQDLRAEAESAERLAAVKMIQAEYTDALTLLERALDTYRLARIAGGEKAIAMLGRLHADRGTVQEGIIRLQDLLRLPEIVKAPGNAAVAHVALSRLHFYAGHYEESLQSAEQAEILATRGQDNVVLADAQLRRSSALQLLGRLPESIQVGEMGITMLERSGNQESLARALHTVGTAYLFTGAVRESRDRLSRALDAAYRLGHRSLVALIEPFLCDAWFHLGDWARAQFHAEHLRLRLADETSWYAAHSLIAAGRLELARGDGETATRLLEDAADRARRSDNDIAWCWAQILLADHDVVNGSSSTAIARLQEAIPVRGAYLAGVLPVLAAATLDEGDVGRAAEWARQGVQRTRRDGTDLLLVEALRALAVVLGRREDWDGAERAFTEGLSMTRNHGLPFAEARTLHQYGVMSASRGEVDWARQRYDQALTIFRRLGAGPWIRRLEGEIAGLA
jgi:tetratricopeptide (TPR) repeat protein